MRAAVNGLAKGSGGGYTVGIELFRHIALARPEWKITLAVISGKPSHEEAKAPALPGNCNLPWALPTRVCRTTETIGH